MFWYLQKKNYRYFTNFIPLPSELLRHIIDKASSVLQKSGLNLTKSFPNYIPFKKLQILICQIFIVISINQI